MKTDFQYLIGVDGGGTGTRVVLVAAAPTPSSTASTAEFCHGSVILGRGSAGPSGLMHGAEPAWQAILSAIKMAFAAANLVMPALSHIGIGCGLAGVNNKQWAADFTEKNPGFGCLAIETDAGTTLFGAHQGKAGAIIALGTGSVGEVMLADGSRREVGGWGFPSSDEASGAWLGLRAIKHVQQVLDGRSQSDDFALALMAFCRAELVDEKIVAKQSPYAAPRDIIFTWLAHANQTRFARLAPLVIGYAGRAATATEIMQAAGIEVAKMAGALDPSGQLPLALCGGLAEPMLTYLPPELAARVGKPQADSATGALILLKKQCLRSPTEAL